MCTCFMPKLGQQKKVRTQGQMNLCWWEKLAGRSSSPDSWTLPVSGWPWPESRERGHNAAAL